MDRTIFDRWSTALASWSMDGSSVFEVRLAPHASDVDFALRLVEPKDLHGHPRATPPSHARFMAQGWPQLGFPEPISALWLEFDQRRVFDTHNMDPVGAAPEDPVMCFKLSGNPTARWIAEELWPRSTGRVMPPAQRRCVARCLDALPPEDGGAAPKLLYVFDLSARGSDAIRLELFGLSATAAGKYLERVAGRRAAAQLDEWTQRLGDCDRPHLSFDVYDEVGPRIGWELGFSRLPEHEPGWARLADRLVALGLADPEKREALFRWPGVDTVRSSPRHWPEGGLGHCVRCLSHFKVVTWPDRPAEAKAYLLFENVLKPKGA